MNIPGKNEFYAREKHSLVLYSVIAFRMHRFVDSLIRRPFDFNSISARTWRVCFAFGNRPCINLIDFGSRGRRWYACKKYHRRSGTIGKEQENYHVSLLVYSWKISNLSKRSNNLNRSIA